MGRVATSEELDDLLGPSPSRVEQAASRRQVLGPARVTQPTAGLGPGRVPGGKCHADRMRDILTYISQLPNVARACRLSNIHRATLQLWLEKSQRGQAGDVFDIVVNPDDPPEDHIVARFHELYDAAIESAVDEVDEAAFKMALGQEEVLYHQGHVQYKLDYDLLAMGLTGKDAFQRDAQGRPVPETIIKQDPEMVRFILKSRRKNIYGQKQEIDVRHAGGVLVVQQKAKDGQALLTEESQFRKEAIDVEFEEITEDDS